MVPSGLWERYFVDLTLINIIYMRQMCTINQGSMPDDGLQKRVYIGCTHPPQASYALTGHLYQTYLLYRVAVNHPGADLARCSLTCVIKSDTHYCIVSS
jgi:hypothetical protein